MGKRRDEIKSASRREFLRGATVAAGGVALIGSDLPALAQIPSASPAPPGGQHDSVVRPSSQIPGADQGPAGGPQQPPGADQGAAGGPHGKRPVRASAPAETHLRHLGPLHNLAGTWVGSGFNLISLPDFADNKTFRLKLSATREILEFSHIGGPVPNRGSLQGDINIFGLTYLQRVSDAETNGALHIEPGLWLNVPATTAPAQGATVVRQGSIPHGTSVLAQGPVIPTINGGPQIKDVDSTPFTPAGPITDAGYLAPFTNPSSLPPGFMPTFIKNPNLALQAAILGQTIVETQVLSVSTQNGGGGLLNIPFVVTNANATQFEAIFWIEKVLQPDGVTEFMQLQYTQTVILFFKDISWPHISVATLVKQ
jgi:hypothetical protein